MVVEYSLSFGEIIIGGVLIVLCVILVGRWAYDAVVNVWSKSKTIVVRDQ